MSAIFVLGITELLNSFLAPQTMISQLMYGLLDVSLESCFLANHYFQEILV